MAKKYISHRISHEGSVAQLLLKHGFLTIGFSGGLNIYEAALSGNWEAYNAACDTVYLDKEWWVGNAKRNQPWRFLTLSVGDIVLVPLSSGEFSICEVSGKAKKYPTLTFQSLGLKKGS